MKVIITGAAGNLGSLLAQHMLGGPHALRLMIHKKELPMDVSGQERVEVIRADLERPETLASACEGVDAIVHFAGVLFAPGPGKFLHKTNVEYFKNLVDAALAAEVKKIILISFPHVEGESSPEHPATGRMDGRPESAHARTRLQAEKYLFEACQPSSTTAITLRPGMIYAQGILMIDGARWLAKRRLLGVWRKATPIHLLALPDFNRAVVAAIENKDAHGVYNLGDDQAITLQEFLDRAALHWGFKKPWRAPRWMFFCAGGLVELYAKIFRTASPLTRDFILIGMAPYWSDTRRMKAELIGKLEFPSLADGIHLLAYDAPVDQTLGHDHPIVLFDGVCNLCTGGVQFILRRDPKKRFRFASLQSEIGQGFLRRFGIPPDELETMVLIAKDRAYSRSTAALKIVKGLRWPWPLLCILMIIPRPFLNLLYRFIARRRYRWFGKKETCWVPSPEWKSRFLD